MRRKIIHISNRGLNYFSKKYAEDPENAYCQWLHLVLCKWLKQNKISKQLINYAELAEVTNHKTKNTDKVNWQGFLFNSWLSVNYWNCLTLSKLRLSKRIKKYLNSITFRPRLPFHSLEFVTAKFYICFSLAVFIFETNSVLSCTCLYILILDNYKYSPL